MRFQPHGCNLKWIILSERIQAQKGTYYIIPFIGHFRKGKITGIETDQWLQRLGVGEGVDYKEAHIWMVMKPL